MKTKNKIYARKLSKGIAITTVIFIMAAMVFLEGIFLTNYIYKTGFTRRVVRELDIIESINFVEAVKTGLQNAVAYSFFKASDDVFASGGFCAHDLPVTDPYYFQEDCKIVYDNPSYDCVSWWYVYGNIYYPPTVLFKEYVNNRTFQRFEEYAMIFESLLTHNLDIPQYYPIPEDAKQIVFGTGTEPSADIRISHKDSDGNDVKISYESNLFLISDNSSFNDTIEATTVNLFEMAKTEFLIGRNYVTEKFNKANESMPNLWCQMRDIYCDVTTACAQDCFDGDNCCCKNIYFGHRCEDNYPDCEAELLTYCSDGPTNAEMKYRNDVQTMFDTPETKIDAFGNQFTVEFSYSTPPGCLRTAHVFEQIDAGYFYVHWQDVLPPEESFKCDLVKKDSSGFECGCAQKCTGCEPIASCGECCNGRLQETDGWTSGECPTGEPWNGERTITCPADCCAIEWTCEQKHTESCSGANTYDCTDTDCPGKCCSGEECDCSECDEKEACKGIPCDDSGPCRLDCCELTSDPHRFCVRKDFKCDACCDDGGGCEGRKPCSRVNPSGGECPCGCDYDEEYRHKITMNCRSSACGYDCCVQTKSIYQDVECLYNYFGSAAVEVTTSDTYIYPIGYKSTNLEMPFYVVDGNVPTSLASCESLIWDPATQTMDYSAWGDSENSYCCEASVTDDSSCKTSTLFWPHYPTPPEPPPPPEIPPCPEDKQNCENQVGFDCICGTEVCYPFDYCCAVDGTCEYTKEYCQYGSCGEAPPEPPSPPAPPVPECPTDRQNCESPVGFECMCGTAECYSFDYCCAIDNACDVWCPTVCA